MRKQGGVNAYQQQQKTGVEVAKPEQLIATLFNKLMETLSKARHFMEAEDLTNKIDRMTLAMDILTVLEQSLDHEKGGELAENLQSLYQYSMKRLMEANASNDVAMIDEVSDLMGQIQEGWQSVLTAKIAPANDTIATTG
ncbi:flagellar export chaperone FliS [uncultured Endozoicomonas sp.]|uniref:flagellar export chaperone FliS n=1 Tax=uncultured Endozoicomonas sp. TaxID=432652 RepID=UPI00262466F7|nr:flagellar export chaperone FliS [uncultured Endozoicomonas sp.]